MYICNSLHETNGKHENLNSIKLQLYYHHATYYSCSYVVNFIHEYFMETDLHLQISQHQASLKQENFTLSYHSYTTLPPQNILQLQLHFICTLYSINNLRFTKIRVGWNGDLPLHQGFTTFCYCRPHYFYLYEKRPPMSSSYIYEIRFN